MISAPPTSIAAVPKRRPAVSSNVWPSLAFPSNSRLWQPHHDASVPYKRREFITLLGGAAAWPLAARSQQAERMRRIGVFSALSADHPEWQARLAAFHQGLQELGWIVGRNIRIEHRVGPGDDDYLRRRAAELVVLAPDAIVVNGLRR
jgi:hypothetical protein